MYIEYHSIITAQWLNRKDIYIWIYIYRLHLNKKDTHKDRYDKFYINNLKYYWITYKINEINHPITGVFFKCAIYSKKTSLDNV